MYFLSCSKYGLEMEAVVLHRVGFLEYFCPKQGQDFKPSAAPIYPNMGKVPPPPRGPSKSQIESESSYMFLNLTKDLMPFYLV